MVGWVSGWVRGSSAGCHSLKNIGRGGLCCLRAPSLWRAMRPMGATLLCYHINQDKHWLLGWAAQGPWHAARSAAQHLHG